MITSNDFIEQDFTTKCSGQCYSLLPHWVHTRICNPIMWFIFAEKNIQLNTNTKRIRLRQQICPSKKIPTWAVWIKKGADMIVQHLWAMALSKWCLAECIPSKLGFGRCQGSGLSFTIVALNPLSSSTMTLIQVLTSHDSTHGRAESETQSDGRTYKTSPYKTSPQQNVS
jgi:hypothetical protein